MITLTNHISMISGVGEKTAKLFINGEIENVSDLLSYYPRDYREYIPKEIRQTHNKDWVILHGTISKPNSHFTGRLTTQTAVLTDDTGHVTLRWFNAPYITRSIREEVNYEVRGQITAFAGKKQIVSPQLHIIHDDQPIAKTEIVPLYSSLATLKPGNIRKITSSLFSNLLSLPETLPDKLLTKYHLISRDQAVRTVHFPPSRLHLEDAIHRLAWEELYLLQKDAIAQKALTLRTSNALEIKQDLIAKFLKSLPYQLTDSQKEALAKITSDLQQDVAMQRLLQGEVGSGKTVVAAGAAIATYSAGYRTLIMAPTQILAEQLYFNLSSLLKHRGPTLSLITAKHKGSPNSDIIVGTQALLGKHKFDNVGLVIIDEQHKFGVNQRVNLADKALTPHTLTMTATPIPRTLALTLLSGIDITKLVGLPPGRLPIKTILVEPDKREAYLKRLYTRIKDEYCQAFIVSPLIDESDSEGMSELKSAKVRFAEVEHELPGIPAVLMHGKMKDDEKTKAINSFRDGKAKILVATSMVEVGIDIPSANIVWIESAERFGLASLHQLRGRVGRGATQGFCLVSPTSDSIKTKERLEFFCNTTDGEELAKHDLKTRGAGELYGTSQHGFFDLKIGSMFDEQLLTETFEACALSP